MQRQPADANGTAGQNSSSHCPPTETWPTRSPDPCHADRAYTRLETVFWRCRPSCLQSEAKLHWLQRSYCPSHPRVLNAKSYVLLVCTTFFGRLEAPICCIYKTSSDESQMAMIEKWNRISTSGRHLIAHMRLSNLRK